MTSADREVGCKPLSRSERVAEAIRSAILNGAIYPGEILNQDDLAAQYSVSKCSAREALIQLTAEGLIERAFNRGFFVPLLSLDEVSQLNLLRRHIEEELLRTLHWPDSDTQHRLIALKMEVQSGGEAVHSSRQFVLLEQLRSLVFALSPLKALHREVERLWRRIDRFRAFLPTEGGYCFVDPLVERNGELMLKQYLKERKWIEESVERAMDALPISFRESWLSTGGGTRSNRMRGMQGDRSWKPVNWMVHAKKSLAFEK